MLGARKTIQEHERKYHMKRPLISALLLSAGALAQAPASDLSGIWSVHLSVMGNDSDQNCTITQSAATLTGTCKNDQGAEQKLEGKVDGKKVIWTVKGDYNGSPLTIVYTGTLDGNDLKGTVDVDPYGVTGEFKATKSKQTTP